MLINVSHHRDLEISLPHIPLIDAQGIDPEQINCSAPSHLSKKSPKVWSDLNAMSIEIYVPGIFVFSPCVGKCNIRRSFSKRITQKVAADISLVSDTESYEPYRVPPQVELGGQVWLLRLVCPGDVGT